MPLINTSVPNLIQGVSQQPDATRFAGQCEEQENALSSVAEGLKKRPNTRHVGRLLGQAIAANSFVHFIDRDDNEKYVVIYHINGSVGTLQAWNIITGEECEINGSTGGYTASSYLDTTDPRNVLKALTIADNTFLVNTDTHVRYNLDKTDPLDDKGFVYFAQGDYQKKYTVHVGDGNSSLTFPPIITVTVGAFFSEGKYFFRVTNVSSGTGGGGLPPTTPELLKIDFSWGTLAPSVIRLPVIKASYTPDASYGGVKVSGWEIIDGGQFGEQPSSVSSSDLIFSTHGASVLATVDNIYPPNGEAYGNVVSKDSTDARAADTERLAAALYDGTDETTALFTASNLTTGAGSFGRFDPQNNSYTFDATLYDNSIVIEKVTGGVEGMTLRTTDGLAGSGIKAVYKEIDSLASLPTSAPEGFKIEIVGDAELSQDNYWVEFTASTGKAFGEGTWHETVAPDTYKGFDNSTMPLTLKNIGKNSFELSTISYAERKAGDLQTNPQPSFVGKQIRNLTFFKNRLGIITDDSIVFSEAGNFFNFFKNTVTTLLDSAPIDVNVSHSRVTSLRSSAVFQEDLLLFADNAQFAVKGGELLTPKTISVSPVTSYNMGEGVDPLTLGSYIYFPFKRGSYSGIQELALSGTTDTYEAVEVTEHATAYIPQNIIELKGTTSESTIAVLSADDPKSVYIYNYFWNNNQKVLSAWSKFTFGAEVIGIEFIESTLYMVITPDSTSGTQETHLVKLPLESGVEDTEQYATDSEKTILLDERWQVMAISNSSSDKSLYFRASRTSNTYDSTPSNYNFNPAARNIADDYKFVTNDGQIRDLEVKNIGNGSQVFYTGDTVTGSSTYSFGFIGKPYTMKYKFSTQVFKAATGKSASPTASSAMTVRNGAVFFDDTHTFTVKVTPEGRSEHSNVFLADNQPDAETRGAIKFAEGFFRFPVHSKAKHAEIVIENDSPFDSKFSSAEFESFVHPRSKRYG